LVERGFNMRDHGAELLIKIIYSGNYEMETIKFLVQKGANVRHHNDIALRLAMLYGHDALVKFLIQYGARAKSIKMTMN